MTGDVAPRRIPTARLALLLGVLYGGLACELGAQERESIFRATGVALTPRHFPRHSQADVTSMFERGKELGDHAVFIYQWSQPDTLKLAKQMLAESQKWGYTPLLGLSPTVLSGLRGEWDLPVPLRKKVKGKPRFADQAVHRPFIQTAVDLARLKPPYLCLATEINLLAFTDIQEYVTFAQVYKKLYTVVKKTSPGTKVFVSFQWDFLRILDEKEPDRVKEHTKLIDIFRPELDLIAFTTYPADHFSTPAELPASYYEKIFDHVGRKDGVVFMEVGWPSAGKGSETEQLDFVKRLPELMKNVRPRILAWSLLHDVTGSGLSTDLAATGLMTTDGAPKPAYALFRVLGSQY